jgi:hypothetical protein
MVVKAPKQYAIMRYIGGRHRVRGRTGSAKPLRGLRASARRRHEGWTSFLTGACLQLQFAWRVASRGNTRTGCALAAGEAMKPKNGRTLSPSNIQDWRSSIGIVGSTTARALRRRSKLAGHCVLVPGGKRRVDLLTSPAAWPAPSGLLWWDPRARGAADSAPSSRTLPPPTIPSRSPEDRA